MQYSRQAALRIGFAAVGDVKTDFGMRIMFSAVAMVVRFAFVLDDHDTLGNSFELAPVEQVDEISQKHGVDYFYDKYYPHHAHSVGIS